MINYEDDNTKLFASSTLSIRTINQLGSLARDVQAVIACIPPSDVQPSDQIVFFNDGAANLFGYAFEDVRGKSLMPMLPAAVHDMHLIYMQAFHETGASEKRMGMEGSVIEGLRADGSSVTLHIRIMNIDDLVAAAITTPQWEEDRDVDENKISLIAQHNRIARLERQFVRLSDDVNALTTAVQAFRQAFSSVQAQSEFHNDDNNA